MSSELEFRSSADVLQRWLKRSRESQLSHQLMAERLSSVHRWLGMLTIAITAGAGATTLLATLGDVSKVVIGLLTLLAAILSSLQTFLKLEDRTNLHRISGAGYGQVRRKLELAMTLENSEKEIRLKEAEAELNKLATESPSVSKRIFDAAMKRNGQ
ncbi:MULTISPECIES: SLATT domain-containing protein [unclassified Pseudomonas]|uniref:SLATT domain-containing protein n=1 Tax=unclassified Pseudomonas TaxID=196821 RepID=UPI000DA16A0D|nr:MULTISPECIES: SLATT domain-containing protein [unclassified Pseudomonas]